MSVFLAMIREQDDQPDTRVMVWVAYTPGYKGSRWSPPEEPEWWVEQTQPPGHEGWATEAIEKDISLLEDAAATQ